MTVMGQINIRSRVGIMRGQPTRKLSLDGACPSFKGGNEPVYVSNLSTTGMLIETAAPLSVGEPLQVLLPEGDTRLVTVVWANESIFACEFARALTIATIRRIQLQSPPERRIDDENEIPRGDGKLRENLGERIRRLRRERRLTMVHLASRIGVSRPTLWKWEKGSVFPRQDMVCAIARALGVTEKELIYGSERQLNQREDLSIPVLDAAEKKIATKKSEIASIMGVSPSRIKILIET